MDASHAFSYSSSISPSQVVAIFTGIGPFFTVLLTGFKRHSFQTTSMSGETGRVTMSVMLAAPVALTKINELEVSLGASIRGKPEVVRLSLVCLLARGHLLIEDVPGVG